MGHEATGAGATAEAVGAGLSPIAAPGRTIARLARTVERALAEADLSLAQYRVLAFLSEVDGAAASVVAGRLGVSRPSVTGIVDGLVARGLVERQESTEDRRRVEHHLTPTGLEALAAADLATSQALDALGGHADEGTRRRADDGLDAWAEALHRAFAALVEGT